MSNKELSDTLIKFTQLMMTKAHVINNHFVVYDNQANMPQPNATTPTSRIRDLMRMKNPTFHGTKVDEDLQGFIDEVFNVVDGMGVTPR